MTARELFRKDPVKLAIGGLFGAGLALMFAPKSGTETRQRMGKYAEEVYEDAQKYVSKSKDKVVSAAEEGKKYWQERKSRLTSPFEACVTAYAKEKERLSRTH